MDPSGKLFEEIVQYLTSGLSTIMVLEGPGAVDRWRLLCGPEDKDLSANTSTIRGNFGMSEIRNVVHCSER